MLKFRPVWLYSAVTALLITAAAACSMVNSSLVQLSPAAEMTPQPIDTVRIERIELIKEEPLPLKVSAVLHGELSDQCLEIDHIEQSRTHTVFLLQVITKQLETVECTNQPQPFEEAVSLAVEGLAAGSYTVTAESPTGVSSLFNLLVDNVEPTPVPNVGLIEGIVWRDQCHLADEPLTQTTCATTRAVPPNSILDEDEALLTGILVKLSVGDCPATSKVTPEPGTEAEVKPEAAMTLVTGRDGRFQFADLKPGAYCLSVNSQTPENAALLRSGDWISPALGADHIPLELAKGETKTLNFGWNRRTNNLSASGELCRDRATYIADITIPDNTGLTPEAEFTKTWRIRNEGNCAWDDTFSLVPKDQNRTLAETIVAIPEPVQPETELDLSVTLVAPKEVGTYRSNWSLQDEDGQTIGSFYLQILVQEAATEQP